MNTTIMKKLLFIPAIVLALFFTSCSEDGEENSVVDDLDLESEAAVDANFEDVDDIVNAGVEFSSASGRVEEDEILEGATVTHDMNNNIIIIDYGTGVEGPGGRIRKGKVIITYENLRWEPGAFRQVTFEEFSIDDVLVEGIRRLENTSESTDDNPEFSVTLTGGQLTFTDGTTITREVDKLRVWNRAANPINDSVSVTGTANGSRRDGVTYEVEIIERLVYKRGCRVGRVFIPVSGVKQITSGDDVAIIDYGDGECDNIVTVTINDGEPFEMNLRLRGRR